MDMFIVQRDRHKLISIDMYQQSTLIFFKKDLLLTLLTLGIALAHIKGGVRRKVVTFLSFFLLCFTLYTKFMNKFKAVVFLISRVGHSILFRSFPCGTLRSFPF